jgi:chromosome segregation ATPase
MTNRLERDGALCHCGKPAVVLTAGMPLCQEHGWPSPQESAKVKILEGELAHARSLPEQLLTAVHWNEEQRDILAKEIKRLEGLVESRDAEIARLNIGWDESLAQVEELQAKLSIAVTRGNEHLYAYWQLNDKCKELMALLAECYPLVRPGTDLSRRLREALSLPKND